MPAWKSTWKPNITASATAHAPSIDHQDNTLAPASPSAIAAYCDYFRDGRNTADDLEALLNDSFSGVDKPAAIIVEKKAVTAVLQKRPRCMVHHHDWRGL